MGGFLSTSFESNPSSAIATSGMSSPNSPQTHQPKPESEPAHESKNLESDTPVTESSDPPADTNPEEIQENPVGGDGDGEGEEEEEEEGEEVGECGFCLFMKGGGCKDTFVEWEKCVEEGEKNEEDIVEKCFQATAALKKCMEAHSDYYAPLLEAEKAAQEEAEKQLEEGKEEVLDGSEKKEDS